MLLRRALATGLAATLATAGAAVLALDGGLPTTYDGGLELAAATGCASEPDPSTFTPTPSPSATATTSPSPTATPSPRTSPTASPTASPTTPTTPPADPEPVTSVEVVQANIKSGTELSKFRADLRKVFKTCPDFVTYNEVPMRQPQYLAPAGYAIWRTPGQYTGATPVVWRTDRWTAEARGTTMISNLQGYGRGQHVMWGVRYANWVTLRSVDGQQTVSLVSVHIAPKSERTTKLLGPSINRLGALVGQLSSSGPVLVGGDFNRHYKSREYPRALLQQHGMNAVYDLSGRYAPTGDHFGATIDYVMVRPAAVFSVLAQTTRELNSDHDALVVELALPEQTVGEPVVSFAAGTTVNDPLATSQRARGAVARSLLTALRSVPEGGTLRLQTSSLDMRRFANKLLDTARRGVTVQVLTGTAANTPAEEFLVRRLAEIPGSWLRHRPEAIDASVPRTTVLASRAGATPRTVLELDRALARSIVTERTVLRTETAKKAYKSRVRAFGAIADPPVVEEPTEPTDPAGPTEPTEPTEPAQP
ncbi:hypothetical protein GCM10027270_27890 [Nocardioides ginkgobilobae]